MEFTEATRPPVLDLLKVHGPMNVPRLAKLLGVNPTAVREKLAALQREGLVQVAVEKRKVGRPTHLYSLTPRADGLFPQAGGPVAISILRQLRELDGDSKIDKLFARRTRELAARYRQELSGRSVEERFRELAKIRAAEGYMAEAEGRGLTEHHCPIADLAREFPVACRAEKELFEAVLGVPLDRVEHLAAGGRSCRYRPATTAR